MKAISLFDPPPNEKQIAGDIAVFEANPVAALFVLSDYFDEDGNPIKEVRPHIMQFVIRRLKLFTEGRPPQSLQQAFKANKQNRNRAITARKRARLHYHITFDRIAGDVPKDNVRALANEYGVSESVVRSVIALVIKEEKAESSQKQTRVSEVKTD